LSFPDFPGARSRDELLIAVQRRGSALHRRRIALVTAPLVLLALVPIAVVAARSAKDPTPVASNGGTTTTTVEPSTTTSTSTTSPPPRTSVVPPTTRAPSTILNHFQPWAAPGKLRPGIKVLGHLSGGSCYAGSAPWPSIGDANNENAWHCQGYQGDGGGDPCFAPPGATNVAEVACAQSPWSGVYLLDLSEPLPSSSTGSKANGVWPWFMTLSNGERCGVIQGTGEVFAQQALNYGCDHGYASQPTASTQPWTVKYLPPGGSALKTLTVTSAWQ